MLQLQQSEATAARRRIPVYLVAVCDGFTPVDGLTGGSEPTIMVSENGAAGVADAGNWTEVDSGDLPGLYYYEFTAAELSTLGFVAVHVSGATIRDFLGIAQVVAFDPYAELATTAQLNTVESNIRGTDSDDLKDLSDQLDGLSDISVSDIFTGIIEGTISLEKLLRLLLARAAGKADGGGTTLLNFRDQADSKDRITMTVDENGNRTNVVVDGS